MNIKEIKELLQLIEEAAIEEFEMERAGVRIRVKKSVVPSAASASDSGRPYAPEAADASARPAPLPEETKKEEELYVFKAPIVGTFYITSKPDAEPFVHPGDRVQKGDVLCIIEAMKLFNQIECDVEGEIARILVENGQPVEYGQPLFEIRLLG